MHYKVLFLCTGNSARSIIAEFVAKRLAGSNFSFESAGSEPKASPHPVALHVLREYFRIEATDARSKSWREFSSLHFDFVITLCDQAKETCPVWPGQPIIAHWGSPDPAAVSGSPAEVEAAFWQVAQQIHRRLQLFFSLPLDKLDTLRLTAATQKIGEDEFV